MSAFDKSVYYDPNDLLGYHALMSMVIGERGNGKTYAFKKRGIENYLNKKKQFYYLRRYESEIKDIGLFFDDIKEEYPTHEFRVDGGKFYMDKHVIGFYSALSKAVTKKSTPFPNVTMIIYDEFILEKGTYHYLQNEPFQLLNFFSTVGRGRNDCMLVLLANAVTEVNPYFLYFKVKLHGKRFTKVNKELVVERTDTEEYRAEMEKTRFSTLITGTTFKSYAIHNQFVSDNHEFIEKKSQNAKNVFNLVSPTKQIIGIWSDFKEGKWWCSFKYNGTRPIYSILNEDLKPNYMLLNSSMHNMKNLKLAIQYGYLYYESFEVKTAMLEVIKYLNIR